MDSSRSLGRRCIGQNCHCDWRLTIYGCEEQTGAYIINMINIGMSALASLVGISILYHRLILQGHRLFDTGSNKGCLRPMPIDSMLFFLTIYNFLRLLDSALLVADAGAGNWILRSWIFEISWQFGYGSFALYLVGIAQTLAESHKAISNDWLPSPKTVDGIGLTLFFAPFVLNNVCVLATGILAETNLPVAEIFIHLLYVIWPIHCFSLAIAVSFYGWRLTTILKRHLIKFQTSGPRAAGIQAGIFKIRAVVVIIGVCLMTFAAFILLYSILRDQILTSTVGSLILGGIWNLLGALTTLAVEAAILFSPPTDGKPNFFGLKVSSSGDKPQVTSDDSTGMYDTHFSTYASGQDASFQGTLSHGAFDELRQQHLKYQLTYQQHQIKGHQQRYDEHRLPSAASTFETGIPLEDVVYQDKSPTVGLIQSTH